MDIYQFVDLLSCSSRFVSEARCKSASQVHGGSIGISVHRGLETASLRCGCSGHIAQRHRGNKSSTTAGTIAECSHKLLCLLSLPRQSYSHYNEMPLLLFTIILEQTLLYFLHSCLYVLGSRRRLNMVETWVILQGS